MVQSFNRLEPCLIANRTEEQVGVDDLVKGEDILVHWAMNLDVISLQQYTKRMGYE